jgi:hypothetical protein
VIASMRSNGAASGHCGPRINRTVSSGITAQSAKNGSTKWATTVAVLCA